MSVDALLGGFSQIAREVPSVGDLEGLRCAAGGAFGIEGGAVAADDLGPEPLGRPGRERVRLTVRQEVHWATYLEVDEHGSVDSASVLRR
uniref:Uncharacterized protein n=1 Tax=Streptomyces auratus AGR0001 TaxID=1160718 RepID=J1ZQ31_9ACTN